MTLPNALNLFIGSALIIILIFAECLIKYKNNRYIKKIFCTVLAAAMLALTADFLISCNFTDKNNTSIYVKFIWPFISALLLFIYLFLIIKESRIDSLTGLDNRYSFFELTGRISRSRSGESWVFAMIDINNFRSINEVYGNFEGDNALRNFAKIIKKCGAKTDFAARYGGDEFILAVKVENENAGPVQKLLGEIQDAVDRRNAENARPFKIEFSNGYDIFKQDGSVSMEEFMKHIDSLMYKHKQERRRSTDREGGAR